ncbi:MAG: flavin-containing monooxygenase [Candidatus Kariarchaeaceae archaeon]|jgi:cation diffusion facilitator CzcD-associated flavoprotein CzcO
MRVCVIGAGPSGITAVKHLLQVGLTDIVGYDANAEVGGNWIFTPDPAHSSVYETSHIISSKNWSQYHDYPMPDHYPDYPSHRLLLKYFRDYADHFGVTQYYQFNTRVEKAEQVDGEKWELTLDSGDVEIFDYLVVASGHHWNPRYPDFEGEFTGEYMHSHFYKTHLPFKDKRVLVVGAGNSACDIIVDIARHAQLASLSWRRGYWVVPKHMLWGLTPDNLHARLRWIPEIILKRVERFALKLVVGSMESYGLPKPDHYPTESHPILNTQLLYHLRHGNIHPRKNIARFDGKTVHFEDGTAEEYDTVITATGYKITFPFFDYPELDYSEGDVDLYLKIFHPRFKNMAVIGLTQPQGCIWPLSDTQAQLVANHVTGTYTLPEDIEKRIEKEIDLIKEKYIDSVRHNTEVDYHRYLKKLRKELPRNAVSWQ